jgi:hypothetical protein
MSEILEAEPFLKGTYKSMGDAHRDSFNPEYWRHGITISRGNGWNISEQVARERLVFIGQKLRRLMFGNQYRKKSSIEFYVYKHGAENCFDEHFHALMGVRGNHDWSDRQIAKAIRSIDLYNPLLERWEKPLHVDYDWEDGNQFHSYVSRFVQNGSDAFFII